MKTNALIIVFLLFGIGLNQLSAQLTPPDNKPGTGIVTFYEYWDGISEYFTLPVICGGEEINHLVGSLTGFGRTFFRGGIMTRQNSWYEWELIGNGGEIFKGKDIWKWDVREVINYGHINLLGNKGTHYIASYSYNGDTGEAIFFDIKCPGSN